MDEASCPDGLPTEHGTEDRASDNVHDFVVSRPKAGVVERSETAAPAALDNIANKCRKSEGDPASGGANPVGTVGRSALTGPEWLAAGFAPSKASKPLTLQNLPSKTEGRVDAARSARWLAREVLWHHSSLPRVQSCGRHSISPSGEVGVHKRGDRVGYSGLATCGSVWACPVCSARIWAERRLEIGVALAQATTVGSIAFATYTLRHRKGQDLDMLWKCISKGIVRIGKDKTVKRIRDELGFYGYIRVSEVTHGSNGWHPHAHLVYLFRNEVTEKQRKTLADAEFRAWSASATHAGLVAPEKFCQKIEMAWNDVESGEVDASSIARYMSKAVFDPATFDKPPTVKVDDVERAKVSTTTDKLSMELTGSLTKKGRNKNRTPWEILESFRTTGDMDDLDLWREWEKGSKGKRSVIWSRGLKDMFEIAEIEDEEIAEKEVEGDKLFVVTDWGPVARQAGLGAGLLRAVKVGGFAAGLAFCDAHGIPTALTVDCVGAAGEGSVEVCA